MENTTPQLPVNKTYAGYKFTAVDIRKICSLLNESQLIKIDEKTMKGFFNETFGSLFIDAKEINECLTLNSEQSRKLSELRAKDKKINAREEKIKAEKLKFQEELRSLGASL